MVDAEWTSLQNGSDIRGVATDGVIGERVTLSDEKVSAIGRGFVQWLRQQQKRNLLNIAIGSDCRLNGQRFVEILEDNITRMGCNVLNCGLVSTPAMLVSTQLAEIAADGAIMLTGSHLPFNCSGMKFFASGNDISKDDLSQIIAFAAQPQNDTDDHKHTGTVHITNLMAAYSKLLRNKICHDLADFPDPQHPLAGLKIVVDAGNGSGAFFVSRVLQPLGADTSGSQCLNPDGRFPNHSPNPEDYEAMRSIVEAVRYADADMGILFDTDVDRVAIVDSGGRGINRNELVAMAAAIVLDEHPGTKIVTDSITSTGLGVFIHDILGGKHCRFQRGYRNVINEALRLNGIGDECWLAVETSGHAAFRENNFRDDGAYFATKLVIRLAQLKREGKTLSSLIEKLPVAAESREFRLRILDDDFNRVATDTLSGLRQYVSQTEGWEEVSRNYEGLRVVCNNDTEKGWFICRLSLHDPVMPLNIESDIVGGTDAIITKLKLYFRNLSNIDSTMLYRK